MPEPTSHSPAPSSEVPFVGRERELDLLNAILRRVIDRHGGIVLIGGDAGIGKTRLVQELVDVAKESGARTGWGNSYKWEGTPAYRPWVEILRDHLEALPDEQLSDRLGSHAAEIARILPLVRERIPDLPALPDISPVEGRFRLFDAVAAVLQNAARWQPQVLVFDDLHWADRDSLRLLQFIAREATSEPILILGTYREVEAPAGSLFAEVLADLARVPGHQRIVLRGLAGDEIDQLAHATVGEMPPKLLLSRIREETAGNPLFVSEITRLLASERYSQDALWDDHLPIPSSVLEVIGNHLDRLSRACRDLLGIASVIGHRFSLELLRNISAESEIKLLDLLDEAVAARLIREEAPTAYRFRHTLVEHVVYKRLGTSPRLLTHKKIAEVLRLDPSGQLESVAYHYHRALPLGTGKQAIEFGIQAGDHAMQQLAWEAGQRYYEQVLAIIERQSVSVDRWTNCDVILKCAAALWTIGALPRAQELCREAVAIVRELDDAELLARAALGMIGDDRADMYTVPEAIPMLEEALHMLPDTDASIRVKILTALAACLPTADGQIERKRQLAAESVQVARRLEDRELLLRAFMFQWRILREPSTLQERSHIADEMLGLLSDDTDPALRRWTHFCRSSVALELGDLPGYHRFNRRVQEAEQVLRLPSYAFTQALLRMMWAAVEGRYDEVEDLADSARELGYGPWPRGIADAVVNQQLLLARRETGNLNDYEIRIQQAFINDDPDMHQFWNALRIALQLQTGETERGRAGLVEIDLANLTRYVCWHITLSLLAEIVVELKDKVLGRQLYNALVPYSEMNVLGLGMQVNLGSGAYYVGRLATLLQHWDEAEQHFETALEMNEQMGARPFSAWTEFAYADMLLQRSRSEDRERAAGLLERALATADELGMKRLQHRAEPLTGQLRTGGASEAGDHHGLTPRQFEVLQLVAEGLSDREIGERLFISHHTVMRHVANIFNALGVNSRTAAVAYAIRHDIL